MVAAFKSFAFERISTEKLKATGCYLSVFLGQYNMTAFHSSFCNGMQMKLGFFDELFCMSIHRSFRQDYGKSKFKIYIFLYNVLIL